MSCSVAAHGSRDQTHTLTGNSGDPIDEGVGFRPGDPRGKRSGTEHRRHERRGTGLIGTRTPRHGKRNPDAGAEVVHRSSWESDSTLQTTTG